MSVSESTERLDRSSLRVIDELRAHGALSRAEIGARTGLSRATVAGIVADLRSCGLVVEREIRQLRAGATPALGRPPVLVALDRRAGVAVGIDVGKSHIRVAVADLSHAVLAESEVAIPAELPAADGVEQAGALVEKALADADAPRRAVVGVGVALPGPLDRRTGEIGSSAIVPGWAGVRVQEAFERRLNLPVRVGNDADLGALAEYTWGVAVGVDNFAYVKWATGIGCGLVLDGRPFRGADGIAGEIGHLPIGSSDRFCRCGNRGCLESVAGIQAVLAAVGPVTGVLTASDLVDRAAAGDPVCRRALGDAAGLIGSALSMLVNLLNPRLVTLGGPVARAGHLVLEPLRAALLRSAVPASLAEMRLEVSALDSRAEVLGAVALVLRESGLGINRDVVEA